MTAERIAQLEKVLSEEPPAHVETPGSTRALALLQVDVLAFARRLRGAGHSEHGAALVELVQRNVKEGRWPA